MHHCLSKDELQQFLDFKVDQFAIVAEDVRIWIDLANNWQDELGALTYFLCQILERRAKDGQDSARLIKTFYALPEATWIHIQEFDSQFINYMLRNLRDRRRNLEEELIDLQNRFRTYNYERTLRY